MFTTKICGITELTDLPGIIDSQVDAIGLNFYPDSRRYVTFDSARELLNNIPASLHTVGLFVNSEDQDLRAASDLPLNYWQIHGDETPARLLQIQILLSKLFRQVSPPKLIKALRLLGPPTLTIDTFLGECVQLGVKLDGILIDAYTPKAYGGTGITADWQSLSSWRQSLNIPLILAGGLTPRNVAQAISTVHPDAVDTASGVESTPGRKDAELCRQFVQAAKSAYAH
ncbi:MAG: phosphoribosylanthranilate isomerase [Pirellulales bacterium]|nr:phosphoribosylanthranilate isomerase [Pirellulales bacterium]